MHPPPRITFQWSWCTMHSKLLRRKWQACKTTLTKRQLFKWKKNPIQFYTALLTPGTKDLWISHYKSMKFRLSTISDNITVSFGLYKWTEVLLTNKTLLSALNLLCDRCMCDPGRHSSEPKWKLIIHKPWPSFLAPCKTTHCRNLVSTRCVRKRRQFSWDAF